MKQMVYYDSEWAYEPNSYIDYCNYCNENGIEIQDDNSIHFHNYQMQMADEYWELFNEGLQNSEYKDCEVVIKGYLKLWDGRHDIQAVKLPLLKAVIKCLDGCDNHKVYVKRDGAKTIHIESTHHDGTNVFKLQFTDKSINPDYLW